MDGALQSARRALSIDPNNALGHLHLGTVLVMTGQTAEGRSALGAFERLSPRDPLIADAGIVVIQSYYFERNYEQCLVALQRQLSAYPDYRPAHTFLPRALAQLGRIAEARAALETMRASLGIYDPRQRRPYHRPEDHEHMMEGLRKAGWEG